METKNWGVTPMTTSEIVTSNGGGVILGTVVAFVATAAVEAILEAVFTPENAKNDFEQRREIDRELLN